MVVSQAEVRKAIFEADSYLNRLIQSVGGRTYYKEYPWKEEVIDSDAAILKEYPGLTVTVKINEPVEFDAMRLLTLHWFYYKDLVGTVMMENIVSTPESWSADVTFWTTIYEYHEPREVATLKLTYSVTDLEATATVLEVPEPLQGKSYDLYLGTELWVSNIQDKVGQTFKKVLAHPLISTAYNATTNLHYVYYLWNAQLRRDLAKKIFVFVNKYTDTGIFPIQGMPFPTPPKFTDFTKWHSGNVAIDLFPSRPTTTIQRYWDEECCFFRGPIYNTKKKARGPSGCHIAAIHRAIWYLCKERDPYWQDEMGYSAMDYLWNGWRCLCLVDWPGMLQRTLPFKEYGAPINLPPENWGESIRQITDVYLNPSEHLIAASILGYGFGHAESASLADSLASALVKAQWGYPFTPGKENIGYCDVNGTLVEANRPDHRGGFPLVWKIKNDKCAVTSLPANIDWVSSKPPEIGQYGVFVPTFATATLGSAQALRIYEAYKWRTP